MRWSPATALWTWCSSRTPSCTCAASTACSCSPGVTRCWWAWVALGASPWHASPRTSRNLSASLLRSRRTTGSQSSGKISRCSSSKPGWLTSPRCFCLMRRRLWLRPSWRTSTTCSPPARCPTCSPRMRSQGCARMCATTPRKPALARCKTNCTPSSSPASSRTFTSCSACLPSARASASDAACSLVWSTAAPSTGLQNGPPMPCRRLPPSRWRRSKGWMKP
mmetsp:Transcript_4038/g.6306  ORF Transcript_4038/g.6306 Transcript_4038/m.6306 type:complete len:222 (-) Transcript_4038:4661-5326(-)